MEARSKAHEGGLRKCSKRKHLAEPAAGGAPQLLPRSRPAMEKTTSPVPVTGAQLVILTDDITKQLEWSAMPEF